MVECHLNLQVIIRKKMEKFKSLKALFCFDWHAVCILGTVA